VLVDISWTIRPGERWVLAGGNGAGKTQLLKVIAGAVWPTPPSGGARIYRWRKELWRAPYEVKEEIAYVGPEGQDKYERYGWNHTVEQIVGTGLHRTDIPLNPLTAADLRRIRGILARLGIAHLAERRFLTLSYGERRLTLLARSLAWRPRLLLLDELCNGFDAVNRERALRWLTSTARSRLPWVLATHRLGDVPRSATHAIVLEEGRVVYKGIFRKKPLERWLEGEAPASTKSPAESRDFPGARRDRSGQTERPLVRLERASVYLDDRRVLQDLSLEVRTGQCWVVHGRNGSGKTTLLRTLYGDHAVAVGGKIWRTGIEPGVPLETFKRRVGLVAPHLQADHPQELTVAEVVQSGRHASVGLNDAPTSADRTAARRSLAFFGLGELETRTLRELSYGQLRRVLFARAWASHPKLLLLDEPFAGVDAPTRKALLGHIQGIVAAGTAVVVCSHHRAEWPACVTHELELAEGMARYCGPVRLPSAVKLVPRRRQHSVVGATD
jgi:molybdate transport system ATP-binding protein